MKGLLDILDEYFIGSVNGETEAEKYNAAYGLMVSCLYDIENIFDTIFDTTSFDIEALDNLFEESMMEKFGYKYVVEKFEEEYYFCKTFLNAEEAAAAVIEMSNTHLDYDEIICKIEFLGCDDIAYFNNITVKTIRNW